MLQRIWTWGIKIFCPAPPVILLKLVVAIACYCIPMGSRAQAPDSTAGKLSHLPSRLLDRITSRAASLNQQLTSQTQRYMRRMLRQEARLQRRLSASDSNATKELFNGTAERYAYLANRLRQDSGSRSMLVSGAYQ